MNPLWQIWTTSQRWNNEHISLVKFGPVAYLEGFQGFWKLIRPVSSAARNILNVAFKFCNKHMFWTLHKAAETMLRRTDKKQSNTPLWTPLMYLVATYLKELRKQEFGVCSKCIYILYLSISSLSFVSAPAVNKLVLTAFLSVIATIQFPAKEDSILFWCVSIQP